MIIALERYQYSCPASDTASVRGLYLQLQGLSPVLPRLLTATSVIRLFGSGPLNPRPPAANTTRDAWEFLNGHTRSTC